MPAGPCDICGEEPATWLMHNQDNGMVQGLGPNCFIMLGVGMLGVQSSEELDGTMKALGYAPTKATRDARKAAEAPEIDPGRVIAEIVESEPRPPDEVGEDDPGAGEPGPSPSDEMAETPPDMAGDAPPY